MAFERLPTFATAMVLLWGLTGPVPAGAAKLGPLTVSSDFGEPLRALVRVVDVLPDVQPLAAALASPQSYADLGVAFPKSLEGASVRLLTLSNGGWAVQISSLRVVDEPDFNLVLVLSTSAGKQLRQYRLASDASTAAAPPSPEPAAVVAPQAALTPSTEPVREMAPPSDAVVSAAGSDTPPGGSDRRPGPMPAAPALEPASAAASQAPVIARKGDTATSIARRLKPADVSDEQAVMALYRLNERAFTGSVHRLPEGAVLQVPDAIRMREVDVRSARTALRSQPMAAAQPERGAARDRLTLSGGGAGRSNSKHGGRGSNAATDAIAHEAAMSEANSRVRELEGIVAALRALVAAREKQIASIQAELTALQSAPRGSVAAAAQKLAGPIGAASATLVRAPAMDPPLSPIAASAPPDDPVNVPLMVGGAVAVMVLLGALLSRRGRQPRRRRRTAREMNPDIDPR
ncbi:MAG: hypothetical protein NTW15_20340 [Burkholderiales bacterium]|nr:hypothetical protein [Burkholderiales bacterium]